MTNQKITPEIETIIKDHVEGQFPKIYANGKSTLILSPKGHLYALGENNSERFGHYVSELCLKPEFISTDVKSAALGNNYVVYVTKEGVVKIKGNGVLADQFKGFSNASQVVSNGSDSFWIEDENHQWYGFGDNRFETIKELKEEVIHVFHEEEYPIRFTSGMTDSIGRYVNHTKDIPDSQIKANYRYQQLLKEFGEENISLMFKCLDPIDLSDIFYEYSRKGIFPEQVIVKYRPFDIKVIRKNRWIYNPEPLDEAPVNHIKSILQYDVNNRKLCIKTTSVKFVRPGLLGDDYFTISVNENGLLECNKESKSNKTWGDNFLYVWANGHHIVMLNRNGKVWHGEFSDYFGSYAMKDL